MANRRVRIIQDDRVDDLSRRKQTANLTHGNADGWKTSKVVLTPFQE